MTRTQAATYARLRFTILGLGVSEEDFESLLRIERTLHRWSERECNGEIDTNEQTGKVYGHIDHANGNCTVYQIPNLEAGALKRLATIMARYPKLGSYVQGDPRGCALYVYPKQALKVVSCDIDSCYSSVGVAVGF